MVEFRFRLRPVSDIVPWGEPGRATLSWFGLSDGWQCLDTAQGRLLAFAEPDQQGETWLGYQVARLFEDLLGLWPVVAEPVPEDVVARLSAWRDAGGHDRRDVDDPQSLDLWEDATGWWERRSLDFHHLTQAPELTFLRIGPYLHVDWRAPEPTWAVPRADIVLPFADAHRAVARFCEDFLAAMAERVDAIARDGWRREDCTVDVPGLAAEQGERATWPA